MRRVGPRGIVAALFVAAVFAWGLAFCGLGFYLVQLWELHGWSLTTLSALTLLFHLAATVFGFGVGSVMQRTNGRVVFAVGALTLAFSVAAIGIVNSLWQVAIAYLVMAVGRACLSMNPIRATVVAWYGTRAAPRSPLP